LEMVDFNELSGRVLDIMQRIDPLIRSPKSGPKNTATFRW